MHTSVQLLGARGGAAWSLLLPVLPYPACGLLIGASWFLTSAAVLASDSRPPLLRQAATGFLTRFADNRPDLLTQATLPLRLWLLRLSA